MFINAKWVKYIVRFCFNKNIYIGKMSILYLFSYGLLIFARGVFFKVYSWTRFTELVLFLFTCSVI